MVSCAVSTKQSRGAIIRSPYVVKTPADPGLLYPGCCKVSEKNGGPGACVGKFCISELNSHDLVHSFYQHYIENLFIYFQ